jgi:2-polyprenyl-3-methyl-5-hydroxy-6-metoxy-1,4-benzoquinol methylase
VTFKPIDYYDSSRKDVDHFRALEPREHIAISLLRPVMEERTGGRLLDVGCGSGLFLEALDRATGTTAAGWRLIGVDVSEHAIALAQRLPFEFHRANLEDGVPEGDASVDLVYAGEVIEHVYDPDSFLSECHRVLRTDGRLVLTTPNLQAWYNRVLFVVGIQPLFYETSTRSARSGAGPLARLKRQDDPVGHLRLFNRRALLDLLEATGFRARTVRGAVFTALPSPVLAIDRIFTRATSLASDLIVEAVKTPAA